MHLANKWTQERLLQLTTKKGTSAVLVCVWGGGGGGRGDGVRYFELYFLCVRVCGGGGGVGWRDVWGKGGYFFLGGGGGAGEGGGAFTVF